MAVADAYEEVTTAIEPEKKMTHLQALEWIVNSAGHQLDPMIVAAFVSREEVFERLRGSLAEKA
jgi:HD-GYP domain-containing protein (c-di-GMP phosphodiesterase class II)